MMLLLKRRLSLPLLLSPSSLDLFFGQSWATRDSKWRPKPNTKSPFDGPQSEDAVIRISRRLVPTCPKENRIRFRNDLTLGPCANASSQTHNTSSISPPTTRSRGEFAASGRRGHSSRNRGCLLSVLR